MSKIVYSSVFEKEYKRLRKRYKSLPDDLKALVSELREDPEKGTLLKYNLRKVRMAIASKGKGKSGGARVITHTLIMADVDAAIIMVAIYDKSEKENLTDKELLELARKCGLDSIG